MSEPWVGPDALTELLHKVDHLATINTAMSAKLDAMVAQVISLSVLVQELSTQHRKDWTAIRGELRRLDAS
jgi:uncharacterized protein YoxC